MPPYHNDEDIVSLCADCIKEAYLSKIIRKEGDLTDCDQCKLLKVSMSLSEIADYLHRAFSSHFEPGGFNRFTFDQEGEPADTIIESLLEIDFKYCESLKQILMENFGNDASYYEEEQQAYGDETFYVPIRFETYSVHHEWRLFEKRVRENARFFGKKTKAYLDKIFKDIDELATTDGTPVFTKVGKGKKYSTFFRGRFFHEDMEIIEAMERPDLLIGPPPTEHASPGRMNARGISVFYGSTNAQVALAEIRPPVGSRVVMGEFEITKPLILLNLSLLEDSNVDGSVFDPEYSKTLRRLTFLKSLVTLMTRPTNPSKESEYLPTQVIADYLANAYPSNIDGILFPSSQSKVDGLNVVLFNKAAKMIHLDIPEGTTFRSDTEDEVDEGQFAPRYYVEETILPAKEIEKLQKNAPYRHLTKALSQSKEGNLRVKAEKLTVHVIKPIEIDTEDHKVDRDRFVKGQPRYVI